MEGKEPLVHHRDKTPPVDCPFGHVQRIVTGGEGGVANVHVVKITRGTPHVHTGYDEETTSGAFKLVMAFAIHETRVDNLIWPEWHRVQAHDSTPAISEDHQKIAMWSFSSFGRRGYFATFEDTTKVRIQP